MHMDPLMPALVATVTAIIAIGLVVQRIRQPHVVTYLLAGLVLGPSGFRLLTEQQLIARVGEMGVVLLLFFAGLELSLSRFASSWRVPIIGTLAQVLCSVAATFALGHALQWPWPLSLLLGFVVSLSSTAVAIKLLGAWGEGESQIGRDVIGILISQDILLVPMLVCLSLISGKPLSVSDITLQLVVGIAIVALILFLIRVERVALPLRRWLKGDRELELFAAFGTCLGFAFLVGWGGLSLALGGFVGGLVVAKTDERAWLHEALTPFYIIFVAMFFLSIGMMIDLRFIWENRWAVIGLVTVALLSNTIINALVLRGSGRAWRQALYGASLLSMIGELSFVLAAAGRDRGIIASYGYHLTIAVIALTLLLSPGWIAAIRWAMRRTEREPRSA